MGGHAGRRDEIQPANPSRWQVLSLRRATARRKEPRPGSPDAELLHSPRMSLNRCKAVRGSVDARRYEAGRAEQPGEVLFAALGAAEHLEQIELVQFSEVAFFARRFDVLDEDEFASGRHGFMA